MTTLILSDTLPQKDILINSLNVSYYYFSNISQISISNTTRIGFIWENNGYKAPFGTTVYNVILNDTSQTLYYFSQELINFFQLFTNSIVVDLITCNLNDVSFQNDLIILQNILPNITFNYSTNSTGNMPNGDWIMDSSGEDINNIYFNQNIVNYTVILGSSLVSAITHIISSKTFADIASYGQPQNISLTAGDNGSGYSTSINLPFSFSLNDVTYNSFYVTTNGLFSLSASNATSSNKSISSGAFSDIHSTLFPIISPLFANLQSTSIYYLYVNNNKFIVQWNGKISKTSFSIQIILYQYTNNIEFNYLNVNIPINTPYSIGIINDLTTNSYYKSLTATGSNAGLSGTSSVAITTINSSSNGCFHFYNSVTSIGSLQNANLTQHDLMGANLTGANLTYANLTGVDLSNCILTDTNLTGATFTNTITGPITATLGPTLSQSYFVVTNSIGQKFIVGPSVNLTNANLTYTDLTGVDLSNCILTSANLTDVTFTNTITGPITATLGPTLSSSYSVITNSIGQKFIVGPSVNLTNTNLTNAILSNISLSDVNLTSTNLTGATFTNTITGPITATLGPTLSSSYSVITNSIEQKFIVGPSVNLTNTNLTCTNLTGVDLSNCILTSTNLTDVTFTNTITGPITATFEPALSSSYSVITNIIGQKFIVGPSVNLTSKNLTNANLTNANLTGATLTNTILTNANLTNANLNGTTLNGITLSLALQIQIQSTSQLILTTNKTSNRNLNLYKTASNSYQTPSTNVSTTSTYVIPTGTTDNSFYYYKITDTITTGSSPKGWFMYTNIVNVIVNGSSVSCYNEGTKILCLNKKFNDEYVAIENLKKGDFVKTYLHGYKKIALIGKNTMINNPNIFYECMYKLKKSNRKELIDDLLITGYHSILVDDLGDYAEKNNKLFSKIPKIDDKFLLLSSISNEFEKIENTNLYTYYHLVLESENDDDNFGIWANGILSEATSKNNFIEKKYIEI